MAKLIDDMLLIARSKDPYFALKKEQIDLNSLLNNTINYLQIMADEKDITIGITGRGVIEGDPSLLKRAFLNILINSIKYSKHQQQITITISDSEVLNAIQVVIEDSGYGIDSKDLPHIFDRFYRTDHSRSKTIGGTGLGLAIVKSILGLHHADISIKSQLSVGTRIEIIFPK
jgi:signal transduction histidine kinase